MRLSLLVIAAVFPVSLAAHSQTDAESFAEGRVALDRYHDCPNSVAALERVSSGARSAFWYAYAGRAYSCVGRLNDAVSAWQAFDRLSPGHPEVVDSIADLRYRLTVRSQAQAEAERERQAAERQRQAAADSLSARLRDISGTWQEATYPTVTISVAGSTVTAYGRNSNGTRKLFEGTFHAAAPPTVLPYVTGTYFLRTPPSGCDGSEVDLTPPIMLNVSADGRHLHGSLSSYQWNNSGSQCRITAAEIVLDFVRR
jgi:hypothetical protein